MSRPQVVITATAGGQGVVALDGTDISRAVQAFEIHGEAGKVTEVTLHLSAVELDLVLDEPALELVKTYLVAED